MSFEEAAPVRVTVSGDNKTAGVAELRNFRTKLRRSKHELRNSVAKLRNLCDRDEILPKKLIKGVHKYRRG